MYHDIPAEVHDINAIAMVVANPGLHKPTGNRLTLTPPPAWLFGSPILAESTEA